MRGPAGGYELARERRRLYVGEIVRVALRAEEEAMDGEGPRLLTRVVDPIFADAERQALAQLDEITLDELHAQAVAAEGLGEMETNEGDFEI